MMRPWRMLVLGGDGIGPEVIAQARRVVDWFVARRGLALQATEAPYGATAWRELGHLLPPDTLQAVRDADAILFGAIGGPDYDRIPAKARLEGSVLRMRRELVLYANLRPVRHWPALAAACPLRPEIAGGADIALVRENTGGLYFGEPRGVEALADGREVATNTQRYATDEVERVARFAFDLARTRDGHVCSVDKSNVLETGQLWRRTVTALHSRDYPDLRLSHMLVDNCAMQLVRRPTQFDVIVTDNMFGDILSDGAGAIAVSLGMLPSASLGPVGAGGRRPALYEPVHGSAPDIEGRGIANPLGAILSFALALRHSFEAPAEADRLERAVEAALGSGARTADIAAPGEPVLGSAAMGDAVLRALDAAVQG
jgi:3-isopropylmalate dehydrogenase